MTRGVPVGATVRVDVGDSERCLAVCDRFGLDRSSVRTLLADARVPTDGLVFVTGPSGAGKSTLLRQVLARDPRFRPLPDDVDPTLAPVDLVDGPLPEALELLAEAGLAEGPALVTPYAHLSDGQKYRVRLARLLASGATHLCVDEFLTALDRTAARSLAWRFQRLCRRRGLRAIVASSHDDLVDAFGPDHLVRVDLGGAVRVEPHGPPTRPFAGELEVAEGTLDDYLALRRWHYLTGDDEPVDLGDRIAAIPVVRHRGAPVAVRVQVRPYSSLQAEWVPAFARINERLCLNHRTIVHPSYRGLSLTRQLDPDPVRGVRVVLSRSAMSRSWPFQRAAGYVPVDLPFNDPLPEQRTLAALFGDLRLDLHDPAAVRVALQGLPGDVRARIEALARGLFVRKMTAWAGFLADLVDVPIEPEEVAELYDGLVVAGALEPWEVVPEAVPYPMTGLMRRVAP
ncbi:MAG: hypothetical protein ABMB14_17855 [Myxococcota bacterium]